MTDAVFVIFEDAMVLETCLASPTVELFAVLMLRRTGDRDLRRIAEVEDFSYRADLAAVRTLVSTSKPLYIDNVSSEW